MYKSVTNFKLPSCVAALAMMLAIVAAPAAAQDGAPPLGDDFIFFFDGPNVLLPRVDGSVVADPLNQGGENRVHRTQYGNWVASGFFFERNEGVDMTANVSENANEGDTLYVSLLVDPLNAGKPGVSLTIFDKTNDSPATDGTADLEFRLQWPIPEDLRDGAWHDLAIPLPPMTTTALDSAKAGVDVNGNPLAMPLDDNAANWSYGGAWSVGGFGLWAPGDCNGDACFEEFQWDAVHGIAVFMDNNAGGGPIYLDNVYIGGPSTDISAATAVPTAMTGVTFSAGTGETVVSWTHNEEFGGYNVYTSESAIDAAAIENLEATQIGSVAFNDDAFEVRHSFEVPHPTLAPFPLHYAVTSKSLFGVENTDVSGSSMEVANAELPIQPYILLATEAEGNTIFDNVAGAVVSDDGFPDVPPFVLNVDHTKAGDGPLPAGGDADMSATVKVTIDDLGFMYIYADITDDVHGFAGAEVPGTDTWNYDAIEFGLGFYDVRDVDGGSIVGGSPHIDFQRGATADYQMRFAPRVNEAGDIVNMSVHSSSDPANGGGNVNGEIQGGGGVAEKTDTGWRILVAFPLDSIIDPASDDPFAVPGESEVMLMPFNIAFNDADDTGNRESQMIWSLKANAGGGWWNTPAQWPSVAVAGRATAVDTEELDGELPMEFALEQNYPNPFNPSTTIEFSLAKVENVRLSVYNVLGQRVATLLSGESMQAGQHTVMFDASSLTSGMYFYRIDAGTSFSKTRSMMLLK